LRAPEQHRTELRASLERIGKALELVYTNRVIADDARLKGLDKDPLVRLRMKQIEEAYLAQVWTEQYRKSVSVPDLGKRAEEVYRLQRDRFKEPERFSGSYIVISNKSRTNEAALDIATIIRNRAVAGENFDDLARAHSEDPNYAKNKGRITRVTEKDLESPVASAAFALKTPGEVTPPVVARGGVMLVRMESKTPARTRTFEEVRDGIIDQERERLIGEATDRRIGELKNTAQTTVHSENIGKLRVEIPPSLIEQAVDVGRGTGLR
jgi:parvulin-like peptidyl-prolyl isomerase